MYHGENTFTLSWRQLWGCNSPSGYKNKFSARVVIISASVSFFLCSERIESLWQGLQISKHRGILSLSLQGLTFMCLHSCMLSPFPLLQKQDPQECPLPMAEVCSPLPAPATRGWWEGLCIIPAELRWLWGGFQPCRVHAWMQAGEMCIWLFQSQGKMGFPLQGERNRKKKKEKICFIQNSFEESA